MKRRTGQKLRLPVRIVDGVIEFEYGGPLPLREGTKAEVTVDPEDVDDPSFLERMSERQRIKLLPEGTTLLVMMSNNTPFRLDRALQEACASRADIEPRLGKWFHSRRISSFPHLVPIKIGELLPWQDGLDEGNVGGLWMELEGPRMTGLISSGIVLPDFVKQDDPIRSLNHAYTVLSELYEPQRISHTGNVFEQVLYQEANGNWYPLKLFRNGATADAEEGLARQFWADLKAKLAATGPRT